MEKVKLTQFSHGAGCGCKISPSVLDQILHSETAQPQFSQLLVGNESSDDAAVYDQGDGTCIISTTDFFMPIVDDGFTFGAIASVNAISDVYAMGGEPLMAIAILGWPINKIPASEAKAVLEGSRKICADAGIPLAGGHSIDCPEPVFGLAVTGKVKKQHLKQNSTATVSSLLYLTKPLGVGIVTTAEKKGIVEPAHLRHAIDSMLTLNDLGHEFGKMPHVTALTDVTGFGLLGHLSELCEGSGLSAELYSHRIPTFDFLDQYLSQGSVPGGAQRNWASYGHKISVITERQKLILADPQTSGGLLVAVEERHSKEFEKFMVEQNKKAVAIGRMIAPGDKLISVV